jgi:hypothetical protein
MSAKRGVFSDQSGGHECEEYLILYSQRNDNCRDESIF